MATLKSKVEKSAAIVTIKNAADMTPQGRRDIAAWLRQQASFLLKYHKELSPTFRARYLYAETK